MQYTQNFTKSTFNFNDLPLFTTENVTPIKYSQVVKPVAKALEAVLVKQEPEDKDVQEVRKIMGKLADGLSTDQIKNMITEIDFLVKAWLEEYERNIFDGKTLAELLHEKGGL